MKKTIIFMLTFILILSISVVIYAKYIITKNFSIEVSSSPFYFNAELEKNKVVMDKTGANVSAIVKNYIDSNISEYAIDYEVSLTGNNKFNFSIGDQIIDNSFSATVNGGSLSDENILLRLTPKADVVLNQEETLSVTIKTTSPYAKTIDLPVIINTNPSTLSGIELNFLIKNGEYAPEGDVYEYYSVDANRMQDTTIKKIIFGKYSNYQSKVSGITAEPIDVNRIGVINLYRVLNSDNTTYTIYILSEEGEFKLSDNAAWTFDKLYALESIENLHLLDTSKVTNMRDMFCDCAVLKNVDLSNFKTSQVTDMIGMFARMNEITYLDLTTFDTSNVVKMNQMFTTDPKLQSIYVSEKWKTTSVEEGTTMFSACPKLVGGNGTVYNSSKLDYTMAKIDGSSQGYFTSMYSLADGVNVNAYMKGKTNKDLESWTTSTRFVDTSVTSITFGMTRDYYSIINGYTGVPADGQQSGAIQVYRIPNGNGTYSVYVISNKGAFVASSESSWLFDKFYMLKQINNLNLLDTSKVTLMRDMFCDCASLTTLDLSKFNTSKVTSMVGMFARMYSIQTLDLSSFNTSKVTTMSSMFVVSISSTETHESFQNVVPALKTIYVSNLWNTSGVPTTETIFTNCVNLVGGAGTIFDPTKLTTTYARIDTASTPGYLTLK